MNARFRALASVKRRELWLWPTSVLMVTLLLVIAQVKQRREEVEEKARQVKIEARLKRAKADKKATVQYVLNLIRELEKFQVEDQARLLKTRPNTGQAQQLNNDIKTFKATLKSLRAKYQVLVATPVSGTDPCITPPFPGTSFRSDCP